MLLVSVFYVRMSFFVGMLVKICCLCCCDLSGWLRFVMIIWKVCGFVILYSLIGGVLIVIYVYVVMFSLNVCLLLVFLILCWVYVKV